MSITKKLASVFAGVVVAFVAFGMMASSAAALSVSALMDLGLTAEQAAVVAALLDDSNDSSSCTPVDTMTTSGVQQAVNSLGYVPALAVDGSYGPATRAGVRYLQTMVGASADGVFGPATRAAYNAYVAANCDEAEAEEEEEGSHSNSSLSGGETSIEDMDLSSEDEAEEGQTTHVATLEFDVEDADAMINRLDLTFNNSSVGGSADDEPWDVFEEIVLMIDGEEVASEAIDDEDDWLEEDTNPFEFRLSGLDYVAEEGDTVEIEIHLTTMNNVDDAANANWILGVATDGLRVLDSEGLTSYYDTADTVAFGVDEEGGDEDIVIKASSSDYDAQLLKVEEDDDSSWYEVFKFRLEAEENDIDVDTLVLEVLTTDANYEDVVNDIKVEIDGHEFDDFSVAGAATTSADITFDINKDHTIDAGDTVDVVVMVELREADQDNDGTADGAYDDATVETLQVGVRSVDGEGVDDVNDTSTLNGSAHTLTYAAALVKNVSWLATPNPNGGNGTIDFLFTVDNTDGDEDFVLAAAEIIDTASAAFTDAATFITDSGEGVLTRVSGDAAPATGILSYTVAEGFETRFRVRYTAPAAGTYEANIESVAGVEIDSDDQLSPTLVI